MNYLYSEVNYTINICFSSTSNENLERSKAKRKDGIFEDPVTQKPKTYTSVHVQTDSSTSSPSSADGIINMLTSGEW